MADESWGTEFADSPNYLLLTTSHSLLVRAEHLPGAVLCSLDPEAMGKALAAALAHTAYGDAYACLLGAGWTPHTPAGTGVRATTLVGVVRDTDAWVVVAYHPAWRPTRGFGVRPTAATRTALPYIPADPVVLSGVGRAALLGNTPAQPVAAAEVLPLAESYYLTLRLRRLI